MKWTDKHQLSLNRKRDGFTYADLVSVADNMGIQKSKQMIDQIVEVASNWDVYAKECGVMEVHAHGIEKSLLLLRSK